jgi:hypothetical protein
LRVVSRDQSIALLSFQLVRRRYGMLLRLLKEVTPKVT